MPRLSAFYGIVIYMYARDHGLPHFHAWYGEERASIEIPSGAVLEGRLSRRQATLVRQWTQLHRDDLLEAWNSVTNGEPPGTIEALP